MGFHRTAPLPLGCCCCNAAIVAGFQFKTLVFLFSQIDYHVLIALPCTYSVGMFVEFESSRPCVCAPVFVHVEVYLSYDNLPLSPLDGVHFNNFVCEDYRISNLGDCQEVEIA